jgi:hypothetical protein
MIKGYSGSLYGLNFRTKTFADTWEDATSFVNEYHDLGIPTTITDENATTLYYILYSRYANSYISSSDPNRFKYELFTIIWQYGPAWQKKLEIQKKLRELTDEQLLEGSRQIYNNANNPSNYPANFTDEELQYINNQNVTKNRKGKLEGYALLMSLLNDDVTETFIKKFKKLFLTVVFPEAPLYYINENLEGEEEDE